MKHYTAKMDYWSLNLRKQEAIPSLTDQLLSSQHDELLYLTNNDERMSNEFEGDIQ